MNVFLLEQALKLVFEENLVNLPLPVRPRNRRPGAEALECRPPLVCIGEEPAKTATDSFDAPLVLIQSLAGHDLEGFHHTTLAVRLVVWNEDAEEAEADLQNLLSVLRRTVMMCRSFPLDGKWVAEAASNGQWCPWERPDGQAAQFAQAYFLCHWHTIGF